MSQPLPTILCVDDDLAVLDLLQEFFTRQGFEVLTAMNGLEALLHVSRRRPQAILLDLQMPRLGGLDAVRRIQRVHPEAVVILVSGSPDLLERIRAEHVTVAGVFTKPLDLARISETLTQAGVGPSRTLPSGSAGESAGKARSSIRKRVLVVDDESEVREVLVGYLQSKGFDVLPAGDGDEALRRFVEYHPHVVLLDIQMPGLSGMETLRRIKALGQQTCVIMVSGQADEQLARRALTLGAGDYIRKPVDFTYLSSVLETHLLMAGFDSPENRSLGSA